VREIRIYVPEPLAVGQVVSLPPAALQHVVKVLRLRVGAALTLFDGHGGEYAATLREIERRSALAQIIEHRPLERESPCHTTLMQGLARGERMDWVLQKATELGVSRIIPLVTRRSVVQLDEARSQTRLLHWQGVIASACEQCGRNSLPELLPPLALPEACARLTTEEPLGARWLFTPDAERTVATTLGELGTTLSAVQLLIGPEGGLDEEEIALAQHAGFLALRLGPRILRTETAAVAALTALQCLAGDFR
jgi:16S rRNA (uracil1498-N3)-methyltransferase